MSKLKINEILIGTNNKGKLKEIVDLLPKKVKFFTPEEFTSIKPVENGNTFRQNSLIKARFFSKRSKKICISDDSGLEIKILNNRPGIFSARWGGRKSNFDKAIKRVFKELTKKDKDWKRKKILCRFICVLTIFWPNGKFVISEGKVSGNISPIKIGTKGFGYDPIFIPKGKKLTFGQMNIKSKSRIDHRYKAFKKFKKFF
tara:strand:+ start:29 stop:631 length:603 start_codon:yes stop_codon:yes gene_type:complete